MFLESIGILVQGPKKSCIKATLLYGVEIRLQNKKTTARIMRFFYYALSRFYGRGACGYTTAFHT